MDAWFPFSTLDSFNQEFAIRRFCPARISQEQDADIGEQQENFDELEMELLSPNFSISDPQLCSSLEEELQFVDSFLNAEECCDESGSDKQLEEHRTSLFDHPSEDFENFPMSNDNHLYADLDLPMLVEGDIGSDFLGAVSEMVPAATDAEDVGHLHGVDKGLQIVHSLLACAEAVGCRDTRLANSLLNQIWPSVSPSGNPLQRVAYCFAMGLKSRLSLLHNSKANGTSAASNGASGIAAHLSIMISKKKKLEAFHLLHQTTPFVAFGFMAANDAIYQAANGRDFLHIIDVGMQHSLQWPPLIRNLASRSEGAPKSVRITGINGDTDARTGLESSMKGVIEEARTLGVQVEFCHIAEPVTPLLLTAENLRIREGEELFVNSIMSLHKFVKESRGSLKTILQAIKRLNPTLMTVVEQDANHNGPFFLGRFLESLHYYSALFDSLEARLPRDSMERMKIENFHFAEEIHNIVSCEGSDRIERHERVDQWRRQIGRAGFQAVNLNSLSQARVMLSVYGSDAGYTVSSDKGCLLLGWKGRSIMLASAWQVHCSTSS